MRFGQRVRITAVAVAVYGIADDVFEPLSPFGMTRTATGGVRVQHFEVAGQPEPPGPDGGWPGMAVPTPDGYSSPGLEPIDVGQHDRGGHRRIRRMPLEAVGIVVGKTRRQEGRHYASGGDRWGEPEPAYLAQSRTVPVVQVALDTEGGPARVVDVWRDDVARNGAPPGGAV